jgi:two-component sensor histidine kinase
MQKASIGFYLISMVCAIALPVLVFVALLLGQLESNERAALESRAEREALSLATGTGRVLQEMATTLRLLVTSPELEKGDLQAFHNRAQAALRSGSLYVLLVDTEGQQLLNTRVPYGAPLGQTSDMESLKAALASRGITASGVFFGQTSQRWVFNVLLPLPEELQRFGAALIITRNADEMNALTTTQGLPPGWTAAILDNAGRVVSSSEGAEANHANSFDAKLPPKFVASSGVAYGPRGDPDSIVGYARPTGWPWTAVVWGPIEAAQASIAATWEMLILGGLILVTLAVAAAAFFARQLSSSIRGIADMAERVGRGEVTAPIESQIREIDMVARTLSTASYDRSQAEDRIRLVLRELAHRTKNLLSVIQAMIAQTAPASGAPPGMQGAISERIAALGRSIDLLTAKQWSGAPIRSVIETHVGIFLGTRDQLQMTGDNFLLKPDAVQNLGLVLHELATNAVKYGALSSPRGRVAMAWQIEDAAAEEQGLRLTWTESGGPPVSQPAAPGFGTKIVEGHAASSFNGRVSVDYRREGLLWTLEAPLYNFVDDPLDIAEAG